jgi:hypothetical protein
MKTVVNSKSSKLLQRQARYEMELEGTILDAVIAGLEHKDKQVIMQGLVSVVTDKRHARMPKYRQACCEAYYRGQMDLVVRLQGNRDTRMARSMILLSEPPEAMHAPRVSKRPSARPPTPDVQAGPARREPPSVPHVSIRPRAISASASSPAPKPLGIFDLTDLTDGLIPFEQTEQTEA